jgi:transcriptional regulator with PAS, ATPase and Fis domain
MAIEQAALDHYCDNLAYFFKDYARVEGFRIPDDVLPFPVDGDVIVISNQIILTRAKPYIPDNSEVVFVDVSFDIGAVERLKAIPRNSRVLLVDFRESMAIALAGLLNQFGIQHLDFVPYAPDLREPPPLEGIDIAVTPNLQQYVPESIRQVFDIGYRKMDIATISCIASILSIDDPWLHKRMIEYEKKICLKKYGITRFLKNLQGNRDQINAVLGGIDDGIIIVDEDKKVINCSEYVCRAFGQNRRCAANNSSNIHPVCKSLLLMGKVENRAMCLTSGKHRKDVVVTNRELELYDGKRNQIVIVKDAEKIRSMEMGIRRQELEKGYKARYTFDDIIHRERVMDDVIGRALRIARSDAATLILGETGTGKELLAQAIHNSSRRSEQPFVAINCAALSDSLLESELFGYEEGSFTGAKRGGKKGLFELAHGGTVFLDELGSISQMMQVKLLRVLQEKEVMRIGGVSLVRSTSALFAATNENMDALVERGVFRKDLYYRINNFSITIPPLRERRSDIPLLTACFMRDFGAEDKTIAPELMEFLVNYEWRGNIRELRNCVEYLAFMGGERLTAEDLPDNIRVAKAAPPAAGQTMFDDEVAVMRGIFDICQKHSVGRVVLRDMLAQQGVVTSEYRLRRILEYMKQRGMVSFGRGREGIRITENRFIG